MILNGNTPSPPNPQMLALANAYALMAGAMAQELANKLADGYVICHPDEPGAETWAHEAKQCPITGMLCEVRIMVGIKRGLIDARVPLVLVG